MELAFTKMQGCANDYIYLDCRKTGLPLQIAEWARQLSRRHFSVGADGIICICTPQSPTAHATMRMFNADGSEGKMCGNGIRCVAQWLHEHVPVLTGEKVLRVDTLSGLKTLHYKGNDCWQVEMGCYSTKAADLPAVNMGEGPLVKAPITVQGRQYQASCISVGNPHCVVHCEDVPGLEIEKIGPAFEKHENFPEGVNTEFVQVVDETHLIMRVWERGSGETYACGTGTCATVAAMVEEGICQRETDVQVQLLGGVLTVRICADGSVLMTGPAKTVYEGKAILPE